METNKINKKLFYSLFIVYILLLIWVVIFKCGIPRSIMGTGYTSDPMAFGPLTGEFMTWTLEERFIHEFKHGIMSLEEAKYNIPLNIVVFIPLGILLPIIIKKHRGLFTVLSGFLLSVLVEVFQLFTRLGYFSPFDILFNTLGTIIGFIIYLVLMHFIKAENQAKIINKTCLISLFIFVPVLIFAIIFTGINFEYIIYRFNYRV